MKENKEGCNCIKDGSRIAELMAEYSKHSERAIFHFKRMQLTEAKLAKLGITQCEGD